MWSPKRMPRDQSCRDCSFFPPDQGSLLLLRVGINKLQPKGAGSLSLLLGCRLMPSTSYTFFFHSVPHNSVMAKNKIFQNGYDSNDGINILGYSVKIPSTCSSKQHLKHWLFFESIQIASTLIFCSIFVSLSVLVWFTFIYLFSCHQYLVIIFQKDH